MLKVRLLEAPVFTQQAVACCKLVFFSFKMGTGWRLL